MGLAARTLRRVRRTLRPTVTPTTRVRRALVVAMVALSVLIPAVFGGLTYVWCAPMERALLHTCCPASSHHGREASVEQLCCEAQRVAPLASFSMDAAPDLWVAPAPLVCLLALAVLFAVGSDPPPPWTRMRARLARAGPAPPLYLLHRALLN